MEQRTNEWFLERLGKVTASKIADIIARTKTGFSTSRDNYKAQLVSEILTGVPYEGYKSAAMQDGIDREPAARAKYAERVFEPVTEIGFVTHPTIHRSGASPDGLVGDDGLVEIKCPLTATHINYLIADVVPEKYIPQMQWQLACTGRQWCDFVSFDDRLPENMQVFIKRVDRDDVYISTLEESVRRFLIEVDQTVETLKGKYNA